MPADPRFATDPAAARYYDQRAAEYDEWYEDKGLFTAQRRPGWRESVGQLLSWVESLPSARTLDIACGTGFLTRHLRGELVALDRSQTMAAVASRRLPAGVVVADGLSLCFADRSFERVFTGHFYGHLPRVERERFLAEARRTAERLVVVDAAVRPGIQPEQWQERVLNDGSRHHVYKRYFSAHELAEEIGGEVLFESDWFVAAEVTWRDSGQPGGDRAAR